jgi:hypothetical protein
VLSSPAPSVTAGELVATAASAGDPQVTLLNGGSGLISTRKYRKLTFSLTLETPFGLDGNVGDGSVARIFWGSSTGMGANQITTTNDMLVWPGSNTYSVDLSTLTLANLGLEPDCISTVGCPQIPWGHRSARFFRIDPHESTKLVRFRLGRVTLAATDEVAFGHTFNITYRFDDGASGSTYRANIYLDGDRNPGGRVQIGTQPGVTPNTTLSFAFDPSNVVGLNPNEYYVYVEIVETLAGQTVTETRGAYSSAALRVFNLTSSAPQTTVANPTANSTQPTPFEVRGCAFDAGATDGINVDDIAVFALAGANVTGPQAGTTQVLGLGNNQDFLEFGPVSGTAITCPTATGVFANSGFRIRNVVLSPGNWTLRVISRSTISGEFTRLSDIPFTVTNAAASPTNLRLVGGSGNSITVAWEAPVGGPPIGAYQMDLATNAAFTPISAQVVLPANLTTATQSLPNGAWHLRLRSLAVGGAPGGVSNPIAVSVPFGLAAPGPPVLTPTQVQSNPITLSWTAGPGGAPTNYTVHAGTSTGASDLGSFPLGGLTSISATAPGGLRIYVRVTASNSVGSATSNEINFVVGGLTAPGTPVGLSHTVGAGGVVTFNWSAATSGGAPTSYTVLARFAPTGPVVAALPGVAGTTFSIAAPPGRYYVTVQAVNGAGSSTESNQTIVVVP